MIERIPYVVIFLCNNLTMSSRAALFSVSQFASSSFCLPAINSLISTNWLLVILTLLFRPAKQFRKSSRLVSGGLTQHLFCMGVQLCERHLV